MARASIQYEGDWTGVLGGRYRWRETNGGILVRGEKSERRTKWSGPESAVVPYPQLSAHVLRTFATELDSAVEATGVSLPVLVAMIAGESGGDWSAERKEKHLNDRSFGVAQTLTGTAHQIAMSQGFPREVAEGSERFKLPRRSLPHGGDAGEWRRFLSDTRNSILIGAGVLQHQDARFKLKGDPVLLYACYNAGSPRPSSRSGWGLVNYGSALSGFVNFYGDAKAAIAAAAALS